jgi:hypothetical protein
MNKPSEVGFIFSSVNTVYGEKHESEEEATGMDNPQRTFTLRMTAKAGHQWLTPIILATQKERSGRS